jgi:YggT family protein
MAAAAFSHPLRRALVIIKNLALVVSIVLDVFFWLMVAWVIMSWLLNFNVLNYRNPVVRMIWEFASRITEPVLRPIRRILPSFGGIDLSPMVAMLVIFFVQRTFLLPLAYTGTISW